MSTSSGHTAAKAWRYLALYGPARTLAKVRARRALGEDDGAPVERAARTGQHVGIIGCGNFAFGTIAHYLVRDRKRVIRGAMDVKAGHAAALARAYGAAYSTTDAERVFRDPAIDLVFVASNHASHADYAARAVRAGKAVHIEKPHAVDAAGLDALCTAMEARPDAAVSLGYNRPFAPLFGRLRDALAREEGPTMLSWFVAGHAVAPDHWYAREGEGGRVLGNLCHWIDASRALIAPAGRYPIVLTPVPAPATSGNLALCMSSRDGSVSTLAFSVKSEPFEGVRERLSAHRGPVLCDLVDCQTLDVTHGATRRRYRGRWRDHGHRACIAASYAARLGGGLTVDEVRSRGTLVLAAARAVATGTAQVVEK